MIFPKKRESFDDYFIVCEDVNSYDLAFKDCSFNETMEIMLKLNNDRNSEWNYVLTIRICQRINVYHYFALVCWLWMGLRWTM